MCNKRNTLCQLLQFKKFVALTRDWTQPTASSWMVTIERNKFFSYCTSWHTRVKYPCNMNTFDDERCNTILLALRPVFLGGRCFCRKKDEQDVCCWRLDFWLNHTLDSVDSGLWFTYRWAFWVLSGHQASLFQGTDGKFITSLPLTDYYAVRNFNIDNNLGKFNSACSFTAVPTTQDNITSQHGLCQPYKIRTRSGISNWYLVLYVFSDASLKELVKRVLPLCANYSVVTRFIEGLFSCDYWSYPEI